MFSALLPSYNHRRFLTECALSAAQTRLVTEVLIVDDGSTDGSPDLIARLAEANPKIRVLSERNGNRGAHDRLNELVSSASNRWVAVLNTDDLFLPGRFDAISRIVNNNKAELFFGDLVIIDDEGRRLGLRNAFTDNEHPWPDSWDIDALIVRQELFTFLALQNIVATTTNMIFSRELHKAVGGFRDYRYCHDWDFALRASLEKGRLVYLPSMMSKYRTHSSNTIKEAPGRVVSDVRRMFSNLRRDMPDVFKALNTASLLQKNTYLAQRGASILAVRATDNVVLDVLRRIIDPIDLPIIVLAPQEPSPHDVRYVAEIDHAACRYAQASDFQAIFTSLALRCYDLLLAIFVDKGDAERCFAIQVQRVGAPACHNKRVVGLRGTNGADAPARMQLDEFKDADRSRNDDAPGPWPVQALAIPRSRLLGSADRPLIFVMPAFLAVGGVERLILDTVRRLAAHYDFVIVNTEPLHATQGSMHAEFGDVPIFDLPEIAREDDYLRGLQLLKDWFEPDLIWICNGAPWQVAHAAEIREIFVDIPIVDHMAYDDKEGWIQAYAQQGVRHSDRFVAINKKIRQVMIESFELAPASIDLIYHGTDLTRFSGASPDPEERSSIRQAFGLDPECPLFGMIGRLTAQKRPFDLIELAKTSPGDSFVWVGLGELEERFKANAAKVKNIKLIPAQRDLVPIYKMLDGLIVLSEYEGLPLVLLEAVATGLPVLSTDVGAIAEVLDELGAGRVFSPPGDMASLQAAFRAFKTELPALRRAAVANATRANALFSSDRMAADYERCFRRAIDEKRGWSPIGNDPVSH